MKAEAIMVTPKDNVVTVVHGAKAGEEVHYFKGAELCSVITTEDIPPCHKIAVAPIAKGAHIIKYGEIIGGALRGSGFHIGLKGGRRHGNSRRRRNAVSGCGGQRGTGVAGALEDELIRQDAEQTGPGHADDAQQDSGQAARHQVAKADAGAQAEGKERNQNIQTRLQEVCDILVQIAQDQADQDGGHSAQDALQGNIGHAGSTHSNQGQEGAVIDIQNGLGRDVGIIAESSGQGHEQAAVGVGDRADDGQGRKTENTGGTEDGTDHPAQYSAGQEFCKQQNKAALKNLSALAQLDLRAHAEQEDGNGCVGAAAGPKRRDIASGLEQGGTDGIQNHTQQKRNNHHAARNLLHGF